MNRNRIKKAAVVGLSAALVAGQTMAAPLSVCAAEITKEENVFVNLDASGKTEDITVSDWIRNVAVSSSIKDYSELNNIVNVKGDETFTQNGKELSWNAENNDIYYQGKIDKELPVTMEISYKLDGKEVTAEELAGKSGKVEMHIEYSNHAKEVVKIDGKDTEVNVPFVMVTGVILPGEHFKNVEVENGKIMSDGDKEIVVGYAVPGLKESLDLTSDLAEDIDIPTSVTITADATDFELAGTYTLATAEFLNDFEAEDIDAIDELKDSFDELKDASVKLVDGTKELADGVDTLKDKSGEFTDGIGTLSDGLTKLNTGAGSLKNGIKSYTDGADQLAAGLKKLNAAVKALPEKFKELIAGVSSAKQGADQLVESTATLEQGMASVNGGIDTVNQTLTQVNQLLSSVEGAATNPQLQKAIGTINALVETTGKEGTLKAGAVAVENGISQVNAGQKQLQAGLGTMQEGVSALSGDDSSTASLAGAVKQLTDGANKLTKNSGALIKGASEITNATTQLKEGGDKLNNGADKLSDGISELQDGSHELRDGMKEFHNDGIMKLYNAINDDIADMFDRLEAISDAGKKYNSFAGINEGMDGTVRFIMETAEVKREEK